MNPESKKEALVLFSKLKKSVVKSNSKKVKLDFILAPPSIYLDSISLKNKNTNIKLSGQDIFSEKYTSAMGEISRDMLKDLGADLSIIGHFERRNILGETNSDIAKKVKLLLDSKMKAIVCVGESKRDDQGDFADVLEKQILESLLGVNNFDLKNIILAYEPAWAIGLVGKKVTLDILEQSIILVKKILHKRYGNIADDIKILYGGSLDDSNILELSEVSGLDGFLIGRSSLHSDVFTKIIESFEK
jgi:triosephosphate isomerase